MFQVASNHDESTEMELQVLHTKNRQDPRAEPRFNGSDRAGTRGILWHVFYVLALTGIIYWATRMCTQAGNVLHGNHDPASETALQVQQGQAQLERTLPAAVTVSAKQSKSKKPAVSILESFGNETAFNAYIEGFVAGAGSITAIIVRETPQDAYGQRFIRHIQQYKLNSDSVLLTCHCKRKGGNRQFDERFNMKKSYTDKAASLIPDSDSDVDENKDKDIFICHSPPTVTTMLFSLSELEDGRTLEFIWACHTHKLKKMMCHITDMVVLRKSFKSDWIPLETPLL